MSRPLLTLAITWARFEQEVQGVFVEALRRLASYNNLPRGEEPMNLWLHCHAIRARSEIARTNGRSLPFTIAFDARSQPVPGFAPLRSLRPLRLCVLRVLRVATGAGV